MNADGKIQESYSGPAGAEYPEQELTGRILEGAFAVHNSLGAGFLEKVYSNALLVELRKNGLECHQEVPFKITYRDFVVGDYIADLVVANRVLVELKACVVLDSVHAAQTMNYLKASGIRVELLLNFARPKLEYRRIVC
jgi:GxxExxY protein